MIKDPGQGSSEVSQKELGDDELKKMLAKDLTPAKKENFKVVLRKYPSLFISNYSGTPGVTVVEHQINLKANQKPVAQKLQRLGRIQQEALLAEVRKLTQVGSIYVDPQEERQVANLCGLQTLECCNEEGPLSSSFSG